MQLWPLVLVAALIVGWRAPLGSVRGGGGEMLYFLVAVAIGYPVLAAFCGAMSVRSNLAGEKWLTVPFMAVLGMALARGMNFPTATGIIFGFWGAVVTVIGIFYALQMRAEGRW